MEANQFKFILSQLVLFVSLVFVCGCSSLAEHRHHEMKSTLLPQRIPSNPDIQEALKHGRFQHANPGLDGSPRLKVMHKGTIYLVDARTKEEVASWRIDDAFREQPVCMQSPKGFNTHTIVVVDASGSMRKHDIPGYNSRTEAVYDCLEQDLMEPQLKVSV